MNENINKKVSHVLDRLNKVIENVGMGSSDGKNS